ncbi:MAG: WXG100 family type VII secretion target [Verrucomicrobiota bacterium]|jgi:uncharacterized protein YukE|nr:WXG100 family type VII secretion target [Verrucomicrobiota bacterium]MDD8047084.1 WXG100 family type VII secretion target [Verrucomicrobiota bacterium]MDD8050840.1 WXG100 family type VII secretion target [Verrucomicrobiota bacterium]HCF95831.1 hypothetical protein [Verrucomicrobiota bacterium]
MAKAIMDPEDVRNFANELGRIHDELQQNLTNLQAKFSALGETWEDQEHEKFAEEFRAGVKGLKRFLEFAGKQVPFLLRKAQRIEDYLKQR